MPEIRSRESNLMIMYRIDPGDGNRYTVAVSIISPEQGRDIIRGFTSDYVLVVPMTPRGYAYPFLRNSITDAQYVAARLGLDAYDARLFAAIMEPLTAMAPPDDILAVALAHVAKEKEIL